MRSDGWDERKTRGSSLPKSRLAIPTPTCVTARHRRATTPFRQDGCKGNTLPSENL